MPNAKGGKKFKRGKKNTSFEKKLIYKDPKEDQEYGKVIRAMGNGRFEIQCFDGKTRMGIIAGNMRKRVWVNKDDIILFSKWEFTTDDDKCSIIHKYAEDEVSKLINKKEIPSNFKVSLEDDFNDENDNYFDYSQISSSESDNEDDEEEEKKTKEKVKDKVNDDGAEQEGIEEDSFIETDDWIQKSSNKTKPLPYRHAEGMNVIDIDDI